jgi:hypothetical protein
MPAKGYRSAFCKNGHERTAENVDAGGYCRICQRDYYKRWRYSHKEEGRAAARKWKYGLTEDVYNATLTAQRGRCAICRVVFDDATKATSPHVDHCHKNNHVRGILCDKCNKGLGNFADSIEHLEAAALYLKRQSIDSQGLAA